MQDTVYVFKQIAESSSHFWPPFWGAFLGILSAMASHFLKELTKKWETSYDAICEFERYLGDLVKYVGSTKGLFTQIRNSIAALQYSDFLTIQFKADELPISPDDIRYLSQIDLKNEWLTIKFRMGKLNSDVIAIIESMKSKAEFYNANKEKFIAAQISIPTLYANEMNIIQILEAYIDQRFNEIVLSMAKVRNHLNKKGIWIRLKNRMNFQSRYRPTQQEVEIEEAGIRAEIQDSITLSTKEINGMSGERGQNSI